MASVVLLAGFQPSWFQNGGPHHVGLPTDAVQRWMLRHKLLSGSGYSCKVVIFMDGQKLPKKGSLNYRTGNLTPAKPVFEFFSIRSDSHDASLWARLSCNDDTPTVHLSQGIPEEEQEEIDWTQAPLLPFSAKSEVPYLVEIKAAVQTRNKPHERLVNNFYRFMQGLGYSPIYSQAIDLALEMPPLIVEAKAIEDDGAWRTSIRTAVGQLHEYRWLYLRGAKLLFLASKPVPERWMEYLKVCHGIRCAWPDGESFLVEDLDEVLPVISRQKKKCVEILDPESNQEQGT